MGTMANKRATDIEASAAGTRLARHRWDGISDRGAAMLPAVRAVREKWRNMTAEQRSEEIRTRWIRRRINKLDKINGF